MEPLYGAFRSKARVFGRILHKRRMWADNETRIDLLGFDFLVDELLVIPRRVRAQLPRPASERAAQPVEPANPYWRRHGVTLLDPDGFPVVLVPVAWP